MYKEEISKRITKQHHWNCGINTENPDHRNISPERMLNKKQSSKHSQGLICLSKTIRTSLGPSLELPQWLSGKESACNAEDLSWIPGLGRSHGGRYDNPLLYSSLENPHGQRSLAGYSPRSRKESDTTEQLSMHTHLKYYKENSLYLQAKFLQ